MRRRLRRARRPLIALLALVLALAIGYGLKACGGSDARSSGVGAGVGAGVVASLPHTGGRALSPAAR